MSVPRRSSPTNHRQPSPPAAAATAAKKLQVADARPGLIAFLPNSAVIDRTLQPWVSAAAVNHPVCIIGLLNNGQTACCAQLTSFGDSTLETKYPSGATLARMQQLYVPIEHAKSTYSGAPTVLRLENQQQMIKQTYINTPAWFTIKTTELTAMRGGPRCVDQTSINKLHQLLQKLIKRETAISAWHGPNGSTPMMPLHRSQSWTLADLGILTPPPPPPPSSPNFTAAQRALIQQQVAKAMTATAKPFAPRVATGPVHMTPMPLASISNNVVGRYVLPSKRSSNGICKTTASWARVAASSA
ncbi:hypothetical protein B0A55_03007 [Friedmanniomyces simplex]|uniref:Uncharacterized protein n=1 Tax=Friedmanniomyces simplex TaxID=329884 RepID=A0A4U0XZU9_9PEZI|nr:hypothetical protein B0A55_03007 [Friedmanniomyces simplex]